MISYSFILAHTTGNSKITSSPILENRTIDTLVNNKTNVQITIVPGYKLKD